MKRQHFSFRIIYSNCILFYIFFNCQSYVSVKGYPSAVNWATPRVSNPEPEPVNMHRKLQRQLTLNPACDPRLYQLRRYHQQQQQTGQSPQQQQQQSVINPPRSSMQHRPLTRLASNESSYPVTAMR